MTRPPDIVLLFASFVVFASVGCSASAPPCAFLELDGETTGGGGIVIEDPLDSGDRESGVITVAVSGVSNIPDEDYRATYTIDCDDDGCGVDVECTPDIIDAGQTMSCDVSDITEEGTDACSWSCRIAFQVGHGDTSVCSPVRVTYEILGEHEPE